MSECVVRMEMPQNCFDCILHCDGNFEDGNGYCRGISPYQDYDCRPMEEMRPLWCPIICSLPEGHGRLVDADAYSAEMKDRQDAAWKWRNEAIGEEDEVKLARAEGAFTAFVEAKLTWDKQATIVPAERSET